MLGPTPAYTYLDPDDLTLRDRLAVDRTVLANERTLLAHVRTALGLLGGGGAVIYVGESLWLHALGAVLLVLAPLALAAGVARFVAVRRRLRPLLRRSKEEATDLGG